VCVGGLAIGRRCAARLVRRARWSPVVVATGIATGETAERVDLLDRHAGPVKDPDFRAHNHPTDWSAAVAVLQAEGWLAKVTCHAAPVQVEGRLPVGPLFYFRARHDEVLLAVGGPDPADAPEWEGSEPHHEASYLPAQEGLAIIRHLAKRYDDERQ
jgi:hypothetical protein